MKKQIIAFALITAALGISNVTAQSATTPNKPEELVKPVIVNDEVPNSRPEPTPENLPVGKQKRLKKQPLLPQVGATRQEDIPAPTPPAEPKKEETEK